MVRDLGSLNGTFIGSERVTEALLPAGGLLTVGTVTFRALYGDPDQVQEWLVEESATGPEELETFAPVSGETLRDAAPDDQDDSVEEFEDIEVIEDSAELAGPAEVVDVEDASGEEDEPQVVDVEDTSGEEDEPQVVDVEDASGEEDEPQVPDGEDEADVVDAAKVDDTKQDTDDENDDDALNQFFQQLE